MINKALIKNNLCINVVVVEEGVEYPWFSDYDAVVDIPDGFWLGDSYIDGVWSKNPLVQPIDVGLTQQVGEQQILIDTMLGVTE